MKKATILIITLFAAVVANAQVYDPEKQKMIPDKFIEIPIVIIAVYLAATFILKIIKMILDNRLKYKLLEKGVPAEVVKEFLQPTAKENRNDIAKWTTLFVGLCVGLVVAYLSRPYGNHTVLILAFSTAISFLVYYNFIFRAPK